MDGIHGIKAGTSGRDGFLGLVFYCERLFIIISYELLCFLFFL
jgi:hypothetical protein